MSLDRPRLSLVALLLALAAAVGGLGLPGRVAAHAEVARSAPATGSVQGAPPKRVDIWFTEEVDPKRSTIEVYDARRERVDQGAVRADPSDPRHLSVDLAALTDGSYTVSWRSTSLDDGHQASGTFIFRVGAARLVGAAETIHDRPSPLAVALRWATLVGLALGAGWLFVGLLGAPLAATRRWLGCGGAALALLADLALVPAQAYWPGSGQPSQSLSSALAAMPHAWLARIALEAALAACLVAAARWRLPHALEVGIALATLAVMSLALTSHAAARSTWRAPAVAVEALHLEAVALWIGGLAQIAVAPRLWRAEGRPVVRRFSAAALALAPLAVATGIASAGLTLPSLASLWRSGYGRVLLVKVALVAGVLALAWVNRRRVAAGAAAVARLGRGVRLEAFLGLVAVLVAALLALTALPAPASRQPLHLSLPISADQSAHLMVDPADTGRDRLEFWLAGPDGSPLPDVTGVEVSVAMLERPIDLTDVEPERLPNGRWALTDVPFGVRGWWAVTTRYDLRQGSPVDAVFRFLVPDPTLVRAERDRPADPRGQDLFKAAIARLTELRSMRADEVLTDGIGNAVGTRYQYQAPDKLAYTTLSGDQSIAIGSEQYYKEAGGPWERRDRVDPVRFPENFPAYYSGATGFTLGRQEEVDGELCQILTFYVPEIPGRDEAWYAWWVGTTSHLVRREVMVAHYHYMTEHYTDFDAPASIAPPQATP